MCDKVPFSKIQAERMVKSRKISRISKKKQRVYLCKECYKYHLTTHHNEGFIDIKRKDKWSEEE